MKIKVIDGYGYQMDAANENHDPLDGYPIINHYGEFEHGLKGIIEVNLHRQTEEQKAFLGIESDFVYQII